MPLQAASGVFPSLIFAPRLARVVLLRGISLKSPVLPYIYCEAVLSKETDSEVAGTVTPFREITPDTSEMTAGAFAVPRIGVSPVIVIVSPAEAVASKRKFITLWIEVVAWLLEDVLDVDEEATDELMSLDVFVVLLDVAETEDVPVSAFVGLSPHPIKSIVERLSNAKGA